MRRDERSVESKEMNREAARSKRPQLGELLLPQAETSLTARHVTLSLAHGDDDIIAVYSVAKTCIKAMMLLERCRFNNSHTILVPLDTIIYCI